MTIYKNNLRDIGQLCGKTNMTYTTPGTTIKTCLGNKLQFIHFPVQHRVRMFLQRIGIKSYKSFHSYNMVLFLVKTLNTISFKSVQTFSRSNPANKHFRLYSIHFHCNGVIHLVNKIYVSLVSGRVTIQLSKIKNISVWENALYR